MRCHLSRTDGACLVKMKSVLVAGARANGIFVFSCLSAHSERGNREDVPTDQQV